MRLFLCPGDLYKTEWVHQLPTFERSIALFPTAALEGGHSQKGKGWATPLYQDTRVQMAHTNTKQRFMKCSGKLIALEL